jgi:hypothetical protein
MLGATRRTVDRYTRHVRGKRLASLAMLGAIAPGPRDDCRKRGTYHAEPLLSDGPEHHPGVGWLRLGLSPQPVGPLRAEPLGTLSVPALLWISPLLAILLWRRVLSVLASPVLVRVLMHDQKQSHIKTGIEDWLFRCEFVLERGIPAQA